MKLATESLKAVRDEIGPLLEDHYVELCAHKDVLTLAPDWGRYEMMERDKALKVYTVREEGVLVGYSVFFLHYPPHYVNNLFAHNDVIYLEKDYRKGRHGLALVKYSFDQLKETDADLILWHAKPGTPLHKLLLKLGYIEQDVILGMKL